jgi:hypothetical protein
VAASPFSVRVRLHNRWGHRAALHALACLNTLGLISTQRAGRFYMRWFIRVEAVTETAAKDTAVDATVHDFKI